MIVASIFLGIFIGLIIGWAAHYFNDNEIDRVFVMVICLCVAMLFFAFIVYLDHERGRTTPEELIEEVIQ